MRHIIVIVIIAGIICLSLPTALLPAQTLELQYSTYLGGNQAIKGTVDPYDEAYGMAVDSSGNAYLTGFTQSADFPTLNPYQGSSRSGTWGKDAFITKLGPSGSALVYSTYLGGTSRDNGWDITVDAGENAYVTGLTDSIDFPTSNAYQALRQGGTDAFVVKLGSTGSTLIYSTYLGGAGSDFGRGIAVDSLGAPYVTGYTSSVNEFPVVNPYQASNAGSDDIFVSKFFPSGQTLSYSTFVGGTEADQAEAIAVSGENAYVTGRTVSTDFPLENPYQGTFGGYGWCGDVVVFKLSDSGNSLEYSTFLGGDGGDMGLGIAIDDSLSAYITGCTDSTDFPTENPFQGIYGGGASQAGDAFVSKLGSSGSTLAYSTYLGGAEKDWGYGIAVDSGNDFYAVGVTYSGDFPTADPYQSTYSGNSDAFITRFDSDGSAVIYSTYFGGCYRDTAIDIEIGPSDSAYVAGWTFSTDLPVVNAYQETGGGQLDEDVFVARFRFGDPTPTPLPTPHSPFPIIDYNGDGTSDIAVFRSTAGLWAIRGITRVYFGGSTDEAVPGDYDGDGTTDIGIYRSSSGLWAIRSVTRVYFGSTTDFPVPSDYDGDGLADLGIFRDSSGLWAVRGVTRAYFGSSGDTPVPGYYDGEGTADIGLYRGISGLWAIRGTTRVYFGGSTDEPVPGNYAGTSVWDPAIFRTGSGLWAIRGLSRVYFGGGSDWPVPADLDGDGIDDIGIYRESSGLWAIRGITRIYFGGSTDIPVTR